MRIALLCLLLLGLSGSGQAQTNVIYGNVGNYGLVAQSRVNVTVTLLSPNPRTVGTFVIRQDPISTLSDTNGYFVFTNLLWGDYTYTVAGVRGTTFKLQVQTNSNGTIPIAALTPPSESYLPNPATNYYTQAQIDSIVANIAVGGGGITNGQDSVTLSGDFTGTLTGNATGLADVTQTGFIYFEAESQRWIGEYKGSFAGNLSSGPTETAVFMGSNWVQEASMGSAFLPEGVGLAWDRDANTELFGTTSNFVFVLQGADVARVTAEGFAGNGAGLTNLSLTATTNNLFAWTSAEAYQPTNVVVDANGVIQTAGVLWPDGYGGLLTNTATNATWLTVDAFTITHAGTGLTVVQAAVSRGPLGVVTNKPALTIQ